MSNEQIEIKMKECPWCGSKDGFIYDYDRETNYFLLGFKGKYSDIKENPTALHQMIDFPVIPMHCPKCKYTIFLNKVWSK